MHSTALDSVLGSLQVSSAVVLMRTYQPPWAIAVPAADRLRELMGLPADLTVVPFHLVRRGNFELLTGHGQRMSMETGHMVMCTRGDGHELRPGERRTPRGPKDRTRPQHSPNPTAKIQLMAFSKQRRRVQQRGVQRRRGEPAVRDSRSSNSPTKPPQVSGPCGACTPGVGLTCKHW
jgi:hypothetical protein